MDLALDMSFVVPAVVFTLLAIVFASTLFNKKPITESPSKTKSDEDTKLGLTDRADEMEDVRRRLIHKEDEVKAEEVVTSEKNTRIKQQTESVLAAPAENVRVAQERSATELVKRSNQARPETEKPDIGMNVDQTMQTCMNQHNYQNISAQMLQPVQTEPIPELVHQKGTVHEPVPGATPVEEAVSPVLPELLPDREAAPRHGPGGEPARAPEAAPEEEATSEPLSDEEADSSPVNQEHNAVGAASAEDDNLSLKYSPGKLRTSQLEKMMSKEELQEEHRVQREQLSAIFQLLKDNQETFGEVTEGDVEEQLKLYSI